jgi:hypothetical protein
MVCSRLLLFYKDSVFYLNLTITSDSFDHLNNFKLSLVRKQFHVLAINTRFVVESNFLILDASFIILSLNTLMVSFLIGINPAI